jgi:uncharacterized membrane protein (DUF485 family)
MSNAAAKLKQSDGAAKKTARELIESPDFKALVKRRWTVSFALLAVLFVGYYGFILLVATDKAWVSKTASSAPGAVVTNGILLGIGTIALAWVLVALYVWWANAKYDPEVQRLKDQLKH